MDRFFGIFKIDFASNRIYGLDILRAFAIMFVCIGHGSNLLPERLGSVTNLFVLDGVSIFFVLSGFLIGGILIKVVEKDGLNLQTLRQFWVRRWFRTLPNYFLILITLCILHWLFDDRFAWDRVSRFFIFSQNLFTEHPLWFFPEAWSLSIEEWFYLSFPVLTLLILTLCTTFRKSILYAAITVIVASIAYRYYIFTTETVNTLEVWDSQLRKQVITRLDSLMFGVVGGYLCYYHKTLWSKYKKQLLVCGTFMLLFSRYVLENFIEINSVYTCVFSFTLASVATLFLLPFLNELRTGKGLLHRSITYISLISYSMYLVNYSIVQTWILRAIPWENFQINGYLILISKYSIYWILVISLSILIYKYFEVPMTALREKFGGKSLSAPKPGQGQSASAPPRARI
ncbi:MAG: acyltransferase [Flavobacterium sp.]|nr:MAG: acyltransferase [Flavobacterium sp.]